MEYVGEPNRILMPYDEEAEKALVRVHVTPFRSWAHSIQIEA